jgi:hypothetical protein
MQIFKHLTINDVQLEEFPFKRELSMEAYLIENEGVLSLDNDTFNNVEIIEAELTLKQGRSSKDTDGRIDILATYSEEYIAVIELKLGQLNQLHLEQLEDYLAQKNQILEDYPGILNEEASPIPKWVGVIVGSSIEPSLATKLRDGYLSPDGTQVFALTIQRFKGSDGHVFVTTDTYYNNVNTIRDTSKYLFEGHSLGKGRLVLAVIKSHCEKHPNISFSELEKAFPKSCQGSRGVFTTFEKANEVLTSSGRKRHFLNSDELIQIEDTTIAVSSQWGIRNIDKFIECALKEGHQIK